MSSTENNLTPEEIKEDIAINEASLLKALTDSKSHPEETVKVVVNFRGVEFSFRIRPLTEREYDSCRERNTKYSKNRRLGGMRLPEKTDTVGYHASLIYTATVDEDRARLWDNKTLWNAVNAVTGTDMVDKLIPLAGKKQAIIDQIEKLSGYDDEAEEAYDETVKN